MFSSRTAFDLRTNRLAQHLAARHSLGAPVLDLTQSNPTTAGLVPRSEVLTALSDPAALRYEPDPRGRLSAREAVARDHARRGLLVEPERLVLTASTSEAYSFLFKLLCDPGDRVLVPQPGYPLFDFLGRLESVEVASYPLRYDGRWHLDLFALDQALDSRVRALVLVNPHNPTGVFVKSEERVRIETWCAERGVAVVSDEVFADFALREVKDRAPSFAASGPALAFALGGLSKSVGLPQLKLGWIAVSGPPVLRDEALRRLEVVADSFLSVATPVQIAAPRLLAEIEALQAPIRARIEANQTLAADRVRGTSATLLDAEGGWYAVLQVPATMSEEERTLRLLDEHDVLVHPGYFFDFPEEAFLVLSLLTEPKVFAKGLERIVASLVL